MVLSWSGRIPEEWATAGPRMDSSTRMKTRRYKISRQKACQPCSKAKIKCDRKAGTCGQCTRRALPCTYHEVPGGSSAIDNSSGGPQSGSPDESPLRLLRPGPRSDGTASAGHVDPPATAIHGTSYEPLDTLAPSNQSYSPSTQLAEEAEALDFSCLELTCPINADEISNRWLNTYIPTPGQALKTYPSNVILFIQNALESYTSMVIRGREMPPFVHWSQLNAASSTSPLATCLSLVRICEKTTSDSEAVALGVLQREMTSIYEQHKLLDGLESLAAPQTYFIYAMVLFFRLYSGAASSFPQIMMNLQEIACSTSKQGLVCASEQQLARPKWEAWIVAEAKRRTIFTMYLFDSLLSARDGMPTFLGSELRGLPAATGKTLWRSRERNEWETTYNLHVAAWAEGHFRIDELWPYPADMDGRDIRKRRDRTAFWLESVDEFGMFLYAVTCCTHGV
ncbi:hypothetical protein HJFPF1_12018 [Paramyrothecium foliicola]|nr:hypothetical protein HJFPF1_12018 [Paramyrothecium foliicola]